MIELKMVAAGIVVAEIPGGGKRLVLVDPDSNIRVFVDFDGQAASKLAAELRGVHVAVAAAPWEKPV